MYTQIFVQFSKIEDKNYIENKQMAIYRLVILIIGY